MTVFSMTAYRDSFGAGGRVSIFYRLRLEGVWGFVCLKDMGAFMTPEPEIQPGLNTHAHMRTRSMQGRQPMKEEPCDSCMPVYATKTS